VVPNPLVREHSLGWAVVKSHQVSSTYHPQFGPFGDMWPRLVLVGVAVPFYSVRDWRDVVWSMCRKFKYTPQELFDGPHWRENMRNLEVWTRIGAHVQRYENMRKDPANCVREIASAIGVDLPAQAITDALEYTARLARDPMPLAEGEVDARSQMHRDHLYAPEGGSWRDEWDKATLRYVARHINPLQERFGYPEL
jgi:hypothetical protein